MALESINDSRWTRVSGNFRERAPFTGLGVAPVAAATVLVASAYFLNNWLNDPKEDWSDNTVFRDKATQLHSQLLAIQCAVVGSNVDMKDLHGRLVCPAGTKSDCKPSAELLGRWRSFVGNFSAFFNAATGRTLGPNASDAQGLKSYVDQALKFSREFHAICPKIGSADIYVQKPVEESAGLPWGWIGAGLGVIAVLALLRTPAAPIVIGASERLESGARRIGGAVRDRYYGY